jgi:ferredoxin
MLLVYTRGRYLKPKRCPEKIDVIISSYSGNTAHFADLFLRGAQETDLDVTQHRFHHYKSFNPVFRGDALVIAFPIYGCKPPWPFLYYLVFKLPSGKGKAAYILYTCIGGAENAGILCWLILTLKGYRVMGRNMAVYPLNVPTFRLGTKKLWKFLDTLLPRNSEVDFQKECGRKFARGENSGIPFIFALTPAFLAGILIDNKFFDTFLYRNHVLKKRCNQCGICIDFCPAERLKMVKNYPKAKGTCMLCLGCINNCPKNAMHMWFWTEYGQPYNPKYKRFLNLKTTRAGDNSEIKKLPESKSLEK